ncbi:MAG: phosphoglycerate dehydrogenase [Candidatus Coatesbacteria bacterium]
MPDRSPAPRDKAGRTRFRVLVTDPVAEEGLEILRRTAGFEVDVRLKLAGPELKKALAASDALVVRSETKVTADVMPDGGRLKVVGRAGVGVDNVDVPAATRRGILVMNAPQGNTIAAAEHALALLMALMRNIPAAHASLKSGEWKRSKFVGHELYGKVLGVVGLGRIGGEVAKRARAFGMSVLGSDPLITVERARDLGVELIDLKALLKRADLISLHAPKTTETRHLIGAAELKLMKPGVRIVNCARGGLIDEAALADAIQRGQVAGAALDVFETEPLPATSPLLKLDQVVVTPHLGASTAEAQVNVSVVIAEQIRDYLVSKIVRNAVNAPATSPEAMGVVGPYIALAERMGRFLVQLTSGVPKRIIVEYRGEIAGRKFAGVTAAAVQGVLSVALQDRVNVVNALPLAKERGIAVNEGTNTEPGEFSSLVRITIATATETRYMDGTVIGKDEPHVVGVDGLHLDILPEGVMITFQNDDRPGIVGKVGTILGTHHINIAGLHVCRPTPGQRAFSIFNVDNPVSDQVARELSRLAELANLRVVTV